VREVPAVTFSGRWQAAPGRRPTVAVCGWCARVRVGHAWLPPERVAEKFGLLDDRQPRLSHGVCDTCARELRSALSA
jgi:hypothetical protein